MKLNRYIFKNKLPKLSLIMAIMIMFSACDDFLTPDPLSMYEPNKTLSTRPALESALAMADRHLRSYWTFYNTQDLSLPISTDYMFSDLAVAGKTDDNAIFADIATRLTPTDAIENNNTNRIWYFWGETYTGIKYANTIISYIDKVEGLDEKTINEFKGRAYFHRAFRYLALSFQFNEVPLVTQIVENPKLNYKTTKREAVLEMITLDMEKAIEWVPEQSDIDLVGMVNKAACRQLLIKCYLATGEFEKAKLHADTLIDHSNYSLVQEPFGEFVNPGPETWNITRNVIWDLHRSQNKAISANTEALMTMPNLHGTTAAVQMRSMRNWLPWIDSDQILTPDGQRGMYSHPVVSGNAPNPNYSKEDDYNVALGRGIAHIRPTYFATHSLWYVNGVKDETDLRHNTEVGNWVVMDSLKYNFRNRRKPQYQGKNLQLYADNGRLLCLDTLRCWFDWPHYKTYIPSEEEIEPTSTNHRGGAGDWYLYRLAETYLLRAEAKYYLGDESAVDDVNEVRKRAHCSELYSSVDIGDIVDERARELYMEEWRHMELSRISYSLALSGKTDEWGNVYDKDKLSEDSYWYQRILNYNNYYHSDIVVKSRNYTIAPHNIYWPIPQRDAIDANREGKLRQNPGYDGYDASIPMWDNWEDAVADEMEY